MEIEINLDAMTERYVRSLETRIELYRGRAWSMFALGILIGIITGVAITVREMPRAGTVPELSRTR